MKLDNLSVARKLWLLALFIISALAAAAIYGVRTTDSHHRHLSAELQRYDEQIGTANKWRGVIATNVQRTLALSSSLDPVITEVFSEPNKKGIAQSAEMQNLVAQQATTEADKRALAVVGERRNKVLATVKKLDELKVQGDAATMQVVVKGEFMGAINDYIGALDDFVKVQEQARDEAQRRLYAEVDRAAVVSYAAMAAVVLLSLWGIFVLVRTILRPLHQVLDVTRNIAQGDLTQRIETERRDEFGTLLHSVNDMNARLRELVGKCARAPSRWPLPRPRSPRATRI